ncbi:uncharacterized protein LOC133301719 [Gastrolobium bilobum]|uniref:uncharacterized protein LOC133301719 n=1 Tax=Gastrolobium bilobum TaxID=150636 RepID=UPI002AB0C6A3|nr:uncharacterized protein LOC133301719 [Gastrolobium bilobum]
MKNHLAGTHNQVAACTKVSDEVREMFIKLLNDNDLECSNDKDSNKGIIENLLGKGRGGSSSTTMKQPTINSMVKDRDLVIQDICRCIYGTALPFNLVKSPLFIKMLKSVGEYGREWERFGCTLMSDGWTDGKDRSLTNFLVNSPKGTVFIKSVDTSNLIKDAEKMFELLDEMVMEIGEENVVQVVTDSASALVSAGQKLMDKRKKLFWSPCAAHCLDLMLEDIGGIIVFHNTIGKAKRITTFIYRHTWVLNLFRSFSKNRELARPAITRFATSYLTLKSIFEQKIPLRSMFASEKWEKSPYATRPEAKVVRDILLTDSRFWKSIKYCLKCVTPLVNILRLVDGDSKPAMGYIYEAMDRAKEQIAKKFNRVESRYKDIWEIIDKRWDLQLHRPLHAAGYYLNPKFHYESNFNPDTEVQVGWYTTLENMCPDIITRIKIDAQLEKFSKAEGLFGNTLAIATRDKKQPALWWNSFGAEYKELQTLAIRILSLTCSATGCERNWSVFDQVHSKRRNRLEQQRLNDLVFVKYNLQLEMRQKEREKKGDTYDPICLSDLESDDEWIAEQEEPCLMDGDSWMDIQDSFNIEEGDQNKKRKRGPRNLQADRNDKSKGIVIHENASRIDSQKDTSTINNKDKGKDMSIVEQDMGDDSDEDVNEENEAVVMLDADSDSDSDNISPIDD